MVILAIGVGPGMLNREEAQRHIAQGQRRDNYRFSYSDPRAALANRQANMFRLATYFPEEQWLLCFDYPLICSLQGQAQPAGLLLLLNVQIQPVCLRQIDSQHEFMTLVQHGIDVRLKLLEQVINCCQVVIDLLPDMRDRFMVPLQPDFPQEQGRIESEAGELLAICGAEVSDLLVAKIDYPQRSLSVPGAQGQARERANVFPARKGTLVLGSLLQIPNQLHPFSQNSLCHSMRPGLLVHFTPGVQIAHGDKRTNELAGD